MSIFGGVYKTKLLSALNTSFYFNLTILLIISFYSLTKDPSLNNNIMFANKLQHIATVVSVSIAFTTFAVTISYHTLF